MAKTKEQKRDIVKSLENKIDESKSIIFAEFEALKVKDNEDLRKKLKEGDSEYYVAKKTLFDLAFRNKKIAGLDPKAFSGKVAAIFGYEDEVAPAKIVNDFKKGLDEKSQTKIEFLGGILEDKFMSREEVINLASLPSKQELYAKIVGSINAPVSGFVNALAGNLKNLVYVLKAIEEKK
jgi:large subunit ribosomal protein L10